MTDPILITGASGVLGWQISRHFREIGWKTWGTYLRNRPDLAEIRFEPLDLQDQNQIAGLLEQRFQAVVHCAAWTSPDDCERDKQGARLVNTEATRVLLDHCPEETFFVYVSTDLVFDGEHGRYREEDQPNPVNFYGLSKLEAEQFAEERPNAAVLRIAKLYSNGSPYHPCFNTWMKEKFEAGEPVRLFTDQFRTPVLVHDVARAIESVLRTRRSGLYHLGGPERLSRYEFGSFYARVFGYAEALIQPIRMRDVGLVARGLDCSLDSSKFYDDFSFEPLTTEEGLALLLEEARV